MIVECAKPDTSCAVAVRFDTALGPMLVAWTQDERVCRTAWVEEDADFTEFSAASWVELDGLSPSQREVAEQMIAYAEGQPVDLSQIPVAVRGTAFQQKIWSLCRKIPYGTVLTYGQLASQAGRALAARAVGSAMARNQVPLLIPCHRVVAASGRLGGFSAPQGIDLKTRLLAMESA